jgi:hypothetical protein
MAVTIIGTNVTLVKKTASNLLSWESGSLGVHSMRAAPALCGRPGTPKQGAVTSNTTGKSQVTS